MRNAAEDSFANMPQDTNLSMGTGGELQKQLVIDRPQSAKAHELALLDDDMAVQPFRDNENVRVNALCNDIEQLHEIFRDLAMLVEQQDPIVQNIEWHIENTEVRAEAAVVELQKASRHQRKRRRFFRRLVAGVLAIGAVSATVALLKPRFLKLK